MKTKTYTVYVFAEFPDTRPQSDRDPIPDPWGALLQMGFDDSLASAGLTSQEKLPGDCFVRKVDGRSASEVRKGVTKELERVFGSMFLGAGLRLFVIVAGEDSDVSLVTLVHCMFGAAGPRFPARNATPHR